MTVHLLPLPLELDLGCPIHVPWPAKPPQTEDAPSPSAEGQLREYVQRRYWETLYLPEFLAPVKYLCLDLLRIRRSDVRDPSNEEGAATSVNESQKQGQVHADDERLSERDGPTPDPRAQSTKKRTHAEPTDRPPSLLDGLLLSLPKLEQKHRQTVASLLSDGISPYYSLPPSSEHPSAHLVLREEDVLKHALKLRLDSARAGDEMSALLRTVDADVEQWYRETQTRREAQTTASDNGAAERERMARADACGRRKEELLRAAVGARVRGMRERFERREVMLQIILVLVREGLYPSPAQSLSAEDEDPAAVEVEEYITKKEKKKRKKPRTESVTEDTKSTKKSRGAERRKHKAANLPAEDTEETYDPAHALEMLSDRLALWHAIGAGSDTAQGAKGHGDGREFEADSDSDSEGWARPGRREVEEWDWAQRFCVNVVERYFLGVNRPFCQSLHLKIFGEPLSSPDPVPNDRPIDLDRDDASIHSFGSGPNGGKPRSFSRANSVASLRMERTMSADPAQSIGMEREPSADARLNGKPGVNLPRTKSSAGSSQLFRNRQVGFSRTNSSLLGAGGSGSVNIIMGKRKTMVVPVPRGPAERKVSGDSASMGKPTDLAGRRSTSGGNPSRYPPAAQAPGPATLALATPAKPRANQFGHRPSIHHYPTEGANTGYRQEITGHATSTTPFGLPADFVAETPAIPGGRQLNRSFAGNTAFGRKPSLSNYPGGRTGGMAQDAFDAQPEADDLADFMVDTDEEDDGVLFSSGNRRRFSHTAQGRPSVRRTVEDVPEVPETPLKAV